MISVLKKLFGKTTQPLEDATMSNEHPSDHPLTLEQKVLVQESWEKVKPISETAAELFYGKLFELDPALKPMFANSDMKEQGKKLMLMIGTAVKGLDTLDELVPAVQKLGERHVGYGVEASHYDTVGAALLDTLEKGLADDFTPEAKEAWTITYTTLASVMIEASNYEIAKTGDSEASKPEKEETISNEHPSDHPLTLEQKVLVQESWEKVKPISETAAELFYGKLFELDPALKPMFANSDMKEQGKKLMLMIGTAVKGLDTLDELVPAVQKLGERHVGYGVEASHYDTVGAALLDTLEKGLADDFTPEAKEAWTITYTTLASVMIEASNYGEIS